MSIVILYYSVFTTVVKGVVHYTIHYTRVFTIFMYCTTDVSLQEAFNTF